MSEHEAEVSELIQAWEDENDVFLDDEQFQELGESLAEQAAANDGQYDIDALVDGFDEEDQWDDGALWEAAQPDLEEHSQREFARLEKQLGRKLTQREVGAVAEGMVDQVQRTGELDGQAAFNESYEAKGEPAPDLDNRQDRRKWMAERIADERAADAPDTSEREYDLDNKDDRLAYMVERYTNGTEFEDADEAS